MDEQNVPSTVSKLDSLQCRSLDRTGVERTRPRKSRRNDPGVYIIKLKLPAFGLPVGCVVYVGKGDDVLKRLNQELGKENGPATFFRSIGVMLEKTVIPGSGNNFKFCEHQEIVDWLDEHIEYSIKRCDPRNEEMRLIKKHKPTFNIIHNSKYCYPTLLELRKKARAIAMGTNTAP